MPISDSWLVWSLRAGMCRAGPGQRSRRGCSQSSRTSASWPGSRAPVRRRPGSRQRPARSGSGSGARCPPAPRGPGRGRAGPSPAGRPTPGRAVPAERRDRRDAPSGGESRKPPARRHRRARPEHPRVEPSSSNPSFRESVGLRVGLRGHDLAPMRTVGQAKSTGGAGDYGATAASSSRGIRRPRSTGSRKSACGSCSTGRTTASLTHRRGPGARADHGARRQDGRAPGPPVRQGAHTAMPASGHRILRGPRHPRR
jgi:hypothetical protein